MGFDKTVAAIRDESSVAARNTVVIHTLPVS